MGGRSYNKDRNINLETEKKQDDCKKVIKLTKKHTKDNTFSTPLIRIFY